MKIAAVLGLFGVANSQYARAGAPPIDVVGVENQYADVIAQVGGKYVNVTAIVTDPNTDPHEFEVSPKIARQIAGAKLIVRNGIGYDDWAAKIIAATPDAGRQVVDVQNLLGLPDSTPNPHLWYDPKTMPAVADAAAADLSILVPAEQNYFIANAQKFNASLAPWNAAIIAFRHDFPGAAVAVTEPVGDYLLTAAGANILTPFTLQAAIMNGTDPSPQDVTAQNALLADHKVNIFVYNQQVTDPLTESFLTLAKQNHIPVVGVYETMPKPGYTYQSWMLAEILALRAAMTTQTSTESLTFH